MTEQIIDKLNTLYNKWCGADIEEYEELPKSGSARRYFRLKSSKGTAMGVYNTDKKENEAFLSFSKSLKNAGVNVPQIYGEDLIYNVYLQEDLGNQTLYSLLQDIKKQHNTFNDELINTYRKVLDSLATLQIEGSKYIDFNKCYPRAAFDSQSMTWDLSYFKYYFLKLAHIDFDEQLLENDYNKLISILLEAPCDFFLYRDFQSRNIMIRDGEPWFIDYQGGRRGALQYDVASLLYDAKADIPQDIRNSLLEYYIETLHKLCPDSNISNNFKQYFNSYVLIRIMQAMGAYGYRGFFERKSHFLKSIPFALNNLHYLLENTPSLYNMPELQRVLTLLCNNDELRSIGNTTRLKVTVTSFSYKHAIPTDNSGNGGGFVFDCRALPNPGRYPQYKTLTGKDNEVIAFFADVEDVMNNFLNACKTLVGMSVEKYLERGFTSLTINFGCTGGQHRSVFCAEALAKWLKEKYDVDVFIKHWEQPQLN